MVHRQPRDLVTDQGRQFVANDFRRWCRRRDIRQRFGAIGRHGSLAVIERCIQTLKNECTRRLGDSIPAWGLREGAGALLFLVQRPPASLTAPGGDPR